METALIELLHPEMIDADWWPGRLEDLAHGDLGLALGALSPMAFVNTLLDQGTDAQREMYLPRFCNGEFVTATTALLWAGPFLLIGIGLVFLIRFIRTRVAATATDDALSAEEQARLDTLLDDASAKEPRP